MHTSLAYRLLFLAHLHPFTHAAPSPAPPILNGPTPLSLLNLQPYNESLQFINSTLKADINALPDPFDIRLPGASTTLEVYNYGQIFNSRGTINAEETVLAAMDDAAGHDYEWASQIGTETVLRYGYADIMLVCYPRQQLTWRMWSEAIEAIAYVLDERGLRREFHFLILEEGLKRVVGYGALAVA